MSWLRLIEENMKGKGNKITHLIKEMWAAYLIEILVIILGISITLALEEWRDDGRERRLEKIYLSNLLTDIKTDRQSLDNTEARTRVLLQKADELLHPAPGLRWREDVRTILGRPKFISQDATFSDLKSSGNLHLVNDISLKNLLFAYYDQTQVIKEVQDAEQLATVTVSGPYFLNHVPLDDTDTLGVMAQPRDVAFRNNVLLRVDNRKELLRYYRNADSLAGLLQEALSK
jgi:hypothetical protein